MKFLHVLLRNNRPQHGDAGRNRRLVFQQLDERRVCAASVTSANGLVTITATDGPDTVNVTQSSTHLHVSINGQQFSVLRSGISRIDAHLLAGNDQYNASTIPFRQRLFGGDGADILRGGGNHDQIFGQFGRDVLVGNGGNDLLDGGADVDTLYGYAGADTYAVRDGYQDRLIGVTAEDTVTADTFGTVLPSDTLNHHDNTIYFFGNHIELLRAPAPPGTTGIFYRVRINGQPYKDLFRAANIVTLFTPYHGGTVTVDPVLEQELRNRGWLRLEKLG